MESNEGYILGQFLLWAAGAQSHRGALRDNIKDTSELSQLKCEEMGIYELPQCLSLVKTCF